MPDFFISYTKSDRAWAEWIAWQLEEAGYSTVIQAWDFRPGGSFVTAMQRASGSAERTIAILSPAYLQANFTQPEWQAAFAKDPTGDKGTLLPIRVQTCELTGLLKERIYIDLLNLEESVAKTTLLTGVIGERHKPDIEPKFPRPVQPVFPGNNAGAISESPFSSQASDPSIPKGAGDAGLKITILYRRNAPDLEYLLDLLESVLGAAGHELFIDRHLTLGDEWRAEIRYKVRSSDAVIPLLSNESIWSDNVETEIKTAHEAAQQQGGKPRILPVRVKFTGPLPEPLAAVLDHLQYVRWEGSEDAEFNDTYLTSQILASLKKPLSRPKLGRVTGAVPLESPFYVKRAGDEELLSAITNREEGIIRVSGARQIGKTSLLARGLAHARHSGTRVVVTDLQALGRECFASIQSFYEALMTAIICQLSLNLSPNEIWDSKKGPNDNMRSFILNVVLKASPEPFLWGLDEVDRLFPYTFGEDVFGMFRTWYNERGALAPDQPWSQLTMVMAYATEAQFFITNLNQSPFNVGKRVLLKDFCLDEVSKLNHQYGEPLQTKEEIGSFKTLVGGQPYLTRCGFHEMVTRGIGFSEFEERANQDDGPYGDHLERLLRQVLSQEEIQKEVEAVLRKEPCQTPEIFYRLRSAGIVIGTAAKPGMRCQLYQKYLSAELLSDA